jgi:hypothetical protein
MKRFVLTPRAKYLIVYRHETKPLQIIPVLHAARDVQSPLVYRPKSLRLFRHHDSQSNERFLVEQNKA